jgi:DnaJ-class molecular chaperone
MTGKSHFRVRGVKCGKCERIHTWYKYRVWREGKKVKEEYVGKCDEYGNTYKKSSGYHHTSQEEEQTHQQQNTKPRPYRNPYDVLGVTYYATRAEITKAYRELVKKYHPDINKQVDPRIIVEINVAYHVLTK